ncbi:sclerostin [Brienomyrus brachyistius]|uniref:sclerostin n=1 Tax=Brienomyrus brachyistius TaxID=42636 RepID=UPI0020B43FC0|nr:sclerostin [Brienomyrus brachyistius]
MQVSLAVCFSSSVLFLLQGCSTVVRGWKALKNDATEIIPEYNEDAQQPLQGGRLTNDTINRPKHGGSRSSANAPSIDVSELSCRELRSTRYITDGSCRSEKPVKELLCSGQCVPSHLLPNSILRSKWWRGSTPEYRCVPAHSRTQRVQLQCPQGRQRSYKIRVVTSCKCKRYTRHHNQSEAKEPAVPRPRRTKKRSRLPQPRVKSNAPY